MKSFLIYSRNRLLYSLIKILIIVVIGFILGMSYVKADTLQSFTYFNRTSLPFSTYYSQSEEQEYANDYFIADGLYKYVYVNMCSTGYLSANPQGVDGSITFLAHKFLNTSCSTGGYTGYNSVMIYMISKWNDAGNGNYGISFKENLKNDSDYSVYITVNSITFSDELIYELDSSIQTDILEQNKETNEKLDNLDETIKDSNQQLQDSITESNKETQEVIKDQFNSCRPSINLQPNEFTQGIYNATTGVFSPNSNYLANINFISVKPNTNYVFSSDLNYSFEAYLYDSNKNYIGRAFAENNKFTTTSETYYINWRTLTLGQNSTSIKMQLQEGTVATDYEPYGEEVCSNKLDEAENTRKGIWETIKNLPNMFLDMLKSLFIPEDGYFEEWFNELKEFFELKLGFLATPFTIVIDFVERYLELSPTTDIVINIPDITVPNFEDNIIIHSTSFNWTQTLKSKEALNTLWQLYLSFIDVYLILNFLNLCENKYNRIFGGDTAQYEYYTVEDSYTYDNNTGEVLSTRRNERKTTRKKVDK